jgi:hypothetical protein
LVFSAMKFVASKRNLYGPDDLERFVSFSKFFHSDIRHGERFFCRRSAMKIPFKTIAVMWFCSFLPAAAMLASIAGPASAADELVNEKAAQ